MSQKFVLINGRHTSTWHSYLSCFTSRMGSVSVVLRIGRLETWTYPRPKERCKSSSKRILKSAFCGERAPRKHSARLLGRVLWVGQHVPGNSEDLDLRKIARSSPQSVKYYHTYRQSPHRSASQRITSRWIRVRYCTFIVYFLRNKRS